MRAQARLSLSAVAGVIYRNYVIKYIRNYLLPQTCVCGGCVDVKDITRTPRMWAPFVGNTPMGLINDHAKADDRDGVSRNRQPIWRTASPGASGEAHSLQGQFEKVSKGEVSQASGEGMGRPLPCFSSKVLRVPFVFLCFHELAPTAR